MDKQITEISSFANSKKNVNYQKEDNSASAKLRLTKCVFEYLNFADGLNPILHTLLILFHSTTGKSPN